MDNIERSNSKKIRVMEVFYIEDEKMHIDFFKKEEWADIVEAFFIKGGLQLPEKINESKKPDQLTEDDYSIFFQELGYEVTGFSDYDPTQHCTQTIPWPHKSKEDGDPE